jgi:outer membrane protein
MRILLFIFIFSLLIPSLGRADDLLQIYQLAQENDTTIQAAREGLLATEELYPQARALFLPLINSTASTTTYKKVYSASSVTVSNFTIPLITDRFQYGQTIVALNLSQPIFYYQHWIELIKANEEIKQANASYCAYEQDLIVRTVQRYFNILRAMDNLKFSKVQRKSFSEYYNQTNEAYKAGISPLTDVQTTKARFDSAYAQEISAENNLAVQKELLEEITGIKIDQFALLNESVKLESPEPAHMELWVNKALEQNYSLQAARFLVDARREDIRLNRANHLPTINVNGSFIRSSSANDLFPTPRNTNAYIGVQLTMPIYSGNSIVSKTRQAAHIFEQSQKQMETIYRQVKSNTRQAFLGVQTQISQIAALKQAIASNQIALEAAEESFKAGLFTIVDVLNAQSDLIKSQQDYSNARYDYVIQSILLKQASGTLCHEDIDRINCMLKSATI